MFMRVTSCCFLALALFTTATYSQQAPDPVDPEIVEASDEGLNALQGFRVQDGLVGSLFAAEPLIANPVVFYVDGKGRVFVCESFRQGKGVTDNRNHPEAWVDADLASQTVEDRRKYHESQLGDDLKTYSEQDDRIRVLVDTDRDGTADQSHTFADHFNDLVEGTGAGVLEHQGNVYYTCIPNLWKLRDHDGDWQADSREVLHTGYGVRVAFRGHDLHGLRLGPDGRIYFSIGDRGANVETASGRVKNTESGSVFRCEADGSNLEIFATGLRNPQELAFDDHGNLFTGDNNSDSGDRARWVYVVEGGDSGWRMAYQYLRDRGPFNREKLWHPFHEGQAAYIVPPVANFADGPSGLDYYPGTGFSDAFQGRFFLADFRGTPSRSGIRSFRVEPDGAFFQLAEDDEQPIWGTLATDVQFGPDGGLYISDWVNSWEGIGKGRIYKFTSPDHQADPVVAEVQSLLADGFAAMPTQQVLSYLAHADQRVRLHAQFALASRRETAAITQAATTGDYRLGRIHAMWSLGQIARADAAKQTDIRDVFLGLLQDDDDEVRAQAARLVGELDVTLDSAPLQAKLKDENARVRYFAALSLGKHQARNAFQDIVAMLEANQDQDPILRHGGVMALHRIATDDMLAGLHNHASPPVRLAAVVALRRQQSPKVATFLQDDELLVVLEAARAIHDEPITAAMPDLASLIAEDHEDDALLRRVLNANFRLGQAPHAQALATFAANKQRETNLRLEAIEMLADWETPHARDRVLGMWRPIDERPNDTVAESLKPVIADMAESESAIRLAVASLGGTLGIAEAAPVLKSLVTDSSVRDNQRADALRSLVTMTGKANQAIVQQAVEDESELVRATAIEMLAELDPVAATPVIKKMAAEGETQERQAAITALGTLASAEADETLANFLKELIAGDLAAEVQLETLTAARDRATAPIQSLLVQYETTLDKTSPSDQYRETLHGGDAARGRQIFQEKTSVGCLRCHKVFFRGGEVGPDLGSIAANKSREYLLEAIVDPNKTIAEGFESLMILDEDGKTHIGVLKEETDVDITLMDANGKSVTIPKSTIEVRQPSPSAMPEDLVKQLTKREIRDLVEYLSTLTGRRRFRGFNRPRVQ